MLGEPEVLLAFTRRVRDRAAPEAQIHDGGGEPGLHAELERPVERLLATAVRVRAPFAVVGDGTDQRPPVGTGFQLVGALVVKSLQHSGISGTVGVDLRLAVAGSVGSDVGGDQLLPTATVVLRLGVTARLVGDAVQHLRQLVRNIVHSGHDDPQGGGVTTPGEQRDELARGRLGGVHVLEHQAQRHVCGIRAATSQVDQERHHALAHAPDHLRAVEPRALGERSRRRQRRRRGADQVLQLRNSVQQLDLVLGHELGPAPQGFGQQGAQDRVHSGVRAAQPVVADRRDHVGVAQHGREVPLPVGAPGATQPQMPLW